MPAGPQLRCLSRSSIHFFSALSTSRQNLRTDEYSEVSTRAGRSANERTTWIRFPG